MERDALMKASGFAELESYVSDLLDEGGRVRLKMESPLGVVDELNRRYKGAVDERLALLQEDFRTAENVESQLELYKEDLGRDFEARMAEIENIVLRMNERGDAWLEENIRFANIPELFRQQKVSERFEREVVADTEELVDERVDELIGLDGRQEPQAVAHGRGVRQPPPPGRIRRAPDRGGRRRFRVQPRPAHPVRRQECPGRSAALRQGTRVREAGALHPGAVTQAAALEVGAVGIGGRRGRARNDPLLDVTGIIAAAIIAGYGLFILPNRRRKAREEFREKTDSLRERLGEVVRRQFEAESNRSVERMREAIAPLYPFRPVRARPYDRRRRRPRRPRHGDACLER